jgi:hypothetical protein
VRANFPYDNADLLTVVNNQSLHTYTYSKNGNRTLPGYQTGSDNRLTKDGTWKYS